MDQTTAYAEFRSAFDKIVGISVQCSCKKCHLVSSLHVGRGPRFGYDRRDCAYEKLWTCTAAAVELAFFWLFIEADKNTVVHYNLQNIVVGDTFGILSNDFRFLAKSFTSGKHLHERIMLCFGERTGKRSLAQSNDASTMVPESIMRLEMDRPPMVRYFLYEGLLLFKDHHYRRLLPQECCEKRPSATQSIRTFRSKIEPTSYGEHSAVRFTVKEISERVLQLRSTLLVRGRSIQINLLEIMQAAMEVADAGRCDHRHSAELESELHERVCTTTVAEPRARKQQIAIVQTKGNPTAQLLACEQYMRSVLQTNCCLNCAVQRCEAEGLSQIIVGL